MSSYVILRYPRWIDFTHQILHCETPSHAVDILKLWHARPKIHLWQPLHAASFEARVTEYNQQKSLSSPAQIELHPDHEDRFGVGHRGSVKEASEDGKSW